MDNVSEKLTPLEIKNKEFKKTALGYSPKEVVEFLDEVARAWERVQRREREVTEKMKAMSDEVNRLRQQEKEISKLREDAQKEAQAIREEAGRDAGLMFQELEKRAEEIRQQTEAWIEQVISEVEETERQKSNFMTAFRSALDSHYALLKSREEDAKPLGDRLANFLKQARQQKKAQPSAESSH